MISLENVVEDTGLLEDLNFSGRLEDLDFMEDMDFLQEDMD